MNPVQQNLKKFLVISALTFIFFVAFSFFSATKTFAAPYYWVGATSASTSDAGNWSSTSGGAGGAGVPGASDTAVFDGVNDGASVGAPPAGYWKLDEPTVTADSSGNNNAGTWVGAPTPTASVPSALAGANPYGLTFNGSSQYVKGNDASLISGGGARTISAWIKTPNSYPPSNASSYFFGYGTTLYNSGFGVGWEGRNSNGALQYHIIVTNYGNQAYGNTALAQNTWYHIAVIKPAGSENYTFYVNGVFDGTNTWTAASYKTTNTVLSGEYDIGFDPWHGANDYWNGSIDDVRIYNRALTPTEINTLYSGALGAIDSSLVGWWKLNEPTVPIAAVDSSGNNNTGSWTGSPAATTSVPSAIQFSDPNALTFNGSSQYVSVPDKDSFSFTNGSHDLPFSISTWLYINGRPGVNSDRVVNKRGNTGGLEYQMGTDQNGYVWITLYSGGGSAAYIYTSTTASPIPLSTWTHVDITYDGSGTAAGVKIYINGVAPAQTASMTGTYVSMSNGTSPVYIGTAAWSPGALSFNGSMDDLRIYSRALTPTEVSTLASGALGAVDSLVGWWKFDELMATPDSSGNNNNGTWVGAPTPTASVASAFTNIDPNAITFNGSSQYVSVPTFNGTVYSFSLWIKPTSNITSSTVGTSPIGFQTNSEGNVVGVGNITSYLTGEIFTIVSGVGSRTAIMGKKYETAFLRKRFRARRPYVY